LQSLAQQLGGHVSLSTFEKDEYDDSSNEESSEDESDEERSSHKTSEYDS
jgi:hypothetical protein